MLNFIVRLVNERNFWRTRVAAASTTSVVTALAWIPIPAGAVTCATTAACVFGTNTARGPGVAGTSAQADGVDGKTSFNGTAAHAASGIAGLDLSASAFNTGVFGNSKNGQGVHGSSRAGTGVFGGAYSGIGVHGVSSTGAGVVGETNASSGISGLNAGVVGNSTGTSAGSYGVFGGSTNLFGVYGSSVNSVGVVADTTNGQAAVTAQALSNSVPSAGLVSTSVVGPGLIAGSTGDQEHESGPGLNVFASSTNDYGATISNSLGLGAVISGGTIGAVIGASSIGIVGRSAAGAGSQPLLLTDLSGNALFYVDGNGDVYYRGTVHKFAATRANTIANTFVPAATTPNIEDVGTANLVNGRAIVKLDPAFAQSIDLRTQYHVFLTPNGDTRGLFVASKSPEGFAVRESQGGHGTLAFDYRVVAATLGHGAERMVLTNKAALAAASPHVKLVKAPTAYPKLPSHVRPQLLPYARSAAASKYVQ